jgi:hypothetical protein
MTRMLVPVQPAFLTIAAFGRTFALSRSSIYRLHHSGVLTIRKLGTRSVIAVSDGETLLKSASALPRKASKA